MTFGTITRALQTRPVLMALCPDKHPNNAAITRKKIHSSPLHHLPSKLQQLTLLRIHRHSLTRGDTKEVRIKLSNTLKKPPLTHITMPNAVRVRIIDTSHVPTTILGKGPNDVTAADQHIPQHLR
jgi:hypothetical protein